MNAFGTFLLRRASPLGRSTPHYSSRSLMGRSSFIKFMLMILFLAQQMKIIARNLEN
jgi:hypothetical protein